MFLATVVGIVGSLGLSMALPAEAQTKRRFISIGTGGVTGVYFAAGNAICRMVEEEGYASHAEGRPLALRCAFPSTRGSEENLAEIARGNLDFGLVQSDLQFRAFTNADPTSISAFPELRSVFSLYPEPLHLVVSKDSNIEKFADLAYKRVNLGPPGSGHRDTMEFLMRRHQLSINQLAEFHEFPALEVSRALCHDTIDAFILAVGVPNSIISIATDGCNARIVPLDTAVERAIVRERPYYVSATIPAFSYRTVEADVATFGVISTLVTHKNLESAVVYEVTKAVMQNLKTFRLLHPAFSGLDPQRMIRAGLTAPLHPGAKQFYVEQGWIDDRDATGHTDRSFVRPHPQGNAETNGTEPRPPINGSLAGGAVPMLFPKTR